MHAARDINGRTIVELDKRDWSENVRNFIHRPGHNTNGESIKLNVPEGYAAPDSKDSTDSNDSGVETVVSVVYMTMTPTFSGSIAGYVTGTPVASSSQSPAEAPSSATSVPVVPVASVSSVSDLSSSTLATSTSATPLAQNVQYPAYATTSVASATSAPDMNLSKDSNGMSGGAKAGLAFGIIFALALCAGLFFFCWRRAKKATGREELNEKEQMSEKRGSFFGGAAAAVTSKRRSADSDKSFGSGHSSATAPRLSLRPVTQFFPTFGEQRKSSINVLGKHNGNENPFSDAAVLSEKQGQANPFDEGDGISKTASVKSTGSGSRSWEGSEPPTPKSAQFGTAAAVPVGAASAQSNSPATPRSQNNVHRVQLDFKPSMEDELELKSGQLVRMLHEYDDGWVCPLFSLPLHGPLLIISPGSLHSHGPQPTGCHSSHLPFQDAGQAPQSSIRRPHLPI